MVKGLFRTDGVPSGDDDLLILMQDLIIIQKKAFVWNDSFAEQLCFTHGDLLMVLTVEKVDNFVYYTM